MKNQEWHTIDKSDWAEGPWKQEPDKKQWTDKKTGLPCLIVRNERLGHLCGYVGVPKDHPWYGLDYHDLESVVSVHGGLTYADKCDGEHICHVVEEGEDDVWWLGFDFAHSGDKTFLTPDHQRIFDLHILHPPPFSYTYKDMKYVARECRRLASQIDAGRFLKIGEPSGSEA